MATGAELKPGDRVRLTEDYPATGLKEGQEGTVQEVESGDSTEMSIIQVHWDGRDYDSNEGVYARRMELIEGEGEVLSDEDEDEDAPEMAFQVGDKVLLNLEEYPETIENDLGWEGSDEEKRYYLQFEVVALDPRDSEYNVEIKAPDGTEWWVHEDWLVEATFDPEESPVQPGDECICWIPRNERFHKKMLTVVSVNAERDQAKDTSWWCNVEELGRKSVSRTYLLITKRARQFKEGDVVRVRDGTVKDLVDFSISEEDAVKMQGVVFKVMGADATKVNGHSHINQYNLDTAEVVGASRNWWVQPHCLEEARASEYKSSAPAGKAAAPKAASTKIKTGDKVKVIAKVSEINEKITSDIIVAAKMKGKVCTVEQVDNSPPNIYVKFPDGLCLWLFKDMLEKVE